MRTCTSVAPASNSIATIWRVVLPRTIESSTMTTRLPATSVERVELHADALLAHALVGLDERAADVAVLDQALAERDAALAREADRRRRARVGDRHARGRPRPAPRAASCSPIRTRAPCTSTPSRSRVGPREVEELEDAERARARAARRPASTCTPVLVDDDQLARRDLALELRADEVERAASRTRRPSRRRARRARAAGTRAGRGRRRACPPRARDRVGALELRHRARDRLRERRARRSRSAPRSPRCRRWSASRRRRGELLAQLLVLVRLPLWPSATVRARPWWTSGCAFTQCVEPVVE